ncbi:TetR/AcrR family transcriptional regulator [Nonomuraea angiospora]|uniref:TetR/AcrR family transcriptional regulator n=1 Tax=Nonomuraea angiospora TaxID=46172 RepID=UPI0029A3703A|nr:helix-turn-helix domain-containing protein [Nonomuraea angiospora]MDX3100964.1 helix-turn-helix domain containing protein [Nonomuraea angiospora]
MPATPDGPAKCATATSEKATRAGASRAKRGPYRKTRETQERILAAAMEVFASQGYRASSLREIGDRCGLDQSSILYHFPSKEELMFAVMQERDRRETEQFLALEHLSPSDAASDVAAAFLRLAVAGAQTPGVIELYTVMAAESVTEDHPLADYMRQRADRIRAGLVQWFEYLAEHDQLRHGVEPRDAATNFLALWEGLQLHWLMDRPQIDVPSSLAAYLRLVIRDFEPAP